MSPSNQITQFNGLNFVVWEQRLKAKLYAKGIWIAINKPCPHPIHPPLPPMTNDEVNDDAKGNDNEVVQPPAVILNQDAIDKCMTKDLQAQAISSFF